MNLYPTNGQPLWARFVLCGLLVGFGLGSASCSPSDLAQALGVSTPSESATLPAYPPPNQPIATPASTATLALYPRPTPTSANGTPEQVRSILVTPLPNEKVGVGTIVEVTSPALSTPSQYSIREDSKPGSLYAIHMLFVHDSNTGNEVRLGDDNGDAIFDALTDQYVIWNYGRYIADENAQLKTGLYAYVVATGDQITIATARTGRLGDVKVSGQWVIYSDNEDAKPFLISIRAHNLATGEDVQLSGTIPEPPGRRATDFYDINEGKIAWVEADKAAQQPVVKVYDVTTRATRTLNVSDTIEPLYVSVSSNLVVWRDGFWRGFDMTNDALFTIPGVPQGWENKAGFVQVTAQGNSLQWTLKSDGQPDHYFTAPVILNK